MARKPRIDVGGEIYHVINRANGRATIFQSEEDYRFFENLLFSSLQEHNALCMAYIVMPNHWHLLIKTYADGELSRVMRKITQVHTQQMHIKKKSVGSGHLYQGRYKSFVIDTDNYFVGAVKYIERNAVRAKLCERVEDWRWGSGYHRVQATTRADFLNADLPLDLPNDYAYWVNEATSLAELEALRGNIGATLGTKELLLPTNNFCGV